jgi:hypothetical protein
MQVEFTGSGILVDAALIAPLLQVPPADVSALLRQRVITSACERGIEEHQGQYQLSFFYRNRRARLRIDTSGRVLQRSTTQIAQRPSNR